MKRDGFKELDKAREIRIDSSWRVQKDVIAHTRTATFHGFPISGINLSLSKAKINGVELQRLLEDRVFDNGKQQSRPIACS